MKRLIIPVIISILLISCQNRDENQINIAFPEGPSALTFLKMIQDSAFIEGKKINYIIKSDPLQIISLMMQQKVNFAVLPTVMAANLYNKGVDYRILAVPIWGTLYLVSNDKTIENIVDLQGTTVHLFSQGATADILFRDFINKKNLKNITLNFDYTSNQELAMALSNGKIKTAILSEPLVSQLIINNPNIKIVSGISCENLTEGNQSNIFTQTSLLVNYSFLKAHPESTRKILELYKISCDFSQNNIKEAAIFAERSGMMMDASSAEFSLPLCNIRFEKAEKAERAIFEYLNIFYKINPASIGGKIPDKNFIVTDKQLIEEK